MAINKTKTRDYISHEYEMKIGTTRDKLVVFIDIRIDFLERQTRQSFLENVISNSFARTYVDKNNFLITQIDSVRIIAHADMHFLDSSR